MGGFKKLFKKINLRNVVKTVGAVGSFVPGAGTFIQKGVGAFNKIDQKRQSQKFAQAQANAMAIAEQSGGASALASMMKENPNLGDILIGAGGGALTGAGAVLAGSTTAGQAGATLAQSTLKEWFKKHWWKVAIGVSVLGGVIYFAVRKGNRGVRRRR